MYQVDLTVGFSSKYFEYTSALHLAAYINKTVQYYSRQTAFCCVILVLNAECKFCCLIIVPVEDVNLTVDKECMVEKSQITMCCNGFIVSCTYSFGYFPGV